MHNIPLPISKSIMNRLLLLQAVHSLPLTDTSNDMADDIKTLHYALTSIAANDSQPLTLDLNNCGTAMRFLTAYCAQKEGLQVLLTGSPRMQQRPIRQLVEALQTLGADISYTNRQGFPPLLVKGKQLTKQAITLPDPKSTQFVSALMMIGVEVKTNIHSPYIDLTQYCIDHLNTLLLHPLEADWSAAAFWYEWLALHPTDNALLLEKLSLNSLQGDKAVAHIYAQLGIISTQTQQGIIIRRQGQPQQHISIDFSSTPDLYPAVALTCRRLGVTLVATGTSSLPYKESNRLKAIEDICLSINSPTTLPAFDDHRIAMALLAADLPADNTDCISKSYPRFIDELKALNTLYSHNTTAIDHLPSIAVITPRRGINDDNKGKKYALHKLVSAANTDYVWLQDDDITPPDISLDVMARHLQQSGLPDLLILPLTMTSGNGSLLERLQQTEYAAIQQLTLFTASRGHAVMCSSANLIVKRQQWLDSYPDLHTDIPSGDDMFLLESFKRQHLTIQTLDLPSAAATITPCPTLKSLLRQRTRWAGKADKYKDKDIRLCGFVVLLANIIQLLCPLIILLKFPIEYSLIHKRLTKETTLTKKTAPTFVGTALLLELIYPFYLLICLITGLLQSRQSASF